MIGKIADLELDGSICIATLDIEKVGIRRLYAEARLFMSAIENAFGDDWRDRDIDFEVDPDTRFMIAGFTPVD